MNLRSKIISPLEKVFYNDKFSLYKEYKKSSALKNEKHSLSVVYMNDEYNQNHYCRYICHVSVKGSIAEHVKVYTIDHVPAVFAAPQFENSEGYISTRAGLYPDVLIPIDEKFTLFIVPKHLFSLWIEVDTKNVPAGNHNIEIIFSDENGNILSSCKHTLKVVDAVLPDSNLILTQWLHADCVADYYNIKVFSKSHWKAIENLIKIYAESGNTMAYTPLFTPPLDTNIGGERTTIQLVDVTYENGKYSFGFEKLHKWVNLCKKHGIKYFEMSHLFTQWGALHAPKIIAKVNGNTKKIFGWETDSHGNDYEYFLKCFLPALSCELTSLGISRYTYFHISDEPSPEHLESYKRCSDIIRKYLKGYKIMDAMYTAELYEQRLMDIPVPSITNYEKFKEMDIDTRFAYYCGAPEKCMGRALSMPSSRNRITGVQLYFHRLDGFLHWGFNFYNSTRSLRHINPYYVTDADRQFCAGDSFMVYPAPNFVFYPSLRLKVFRDSLQDFRALKYCEQLYGEKAVNELIAALNDEKELDINETPKDEYFTLKLRELINSMIEQRVK